MRARGLADAAGQGLRMSLLKRWFRAPPAPTAGPGHDVARNGAGPDAQAPAEGVVATAGVRTAARRFGEALALLDDALATAPDDAQLWSARGRTLLAWGRSTDAQAAFLQAEARGGHDADLYLQLGLSFLQTGPAQTAQAWLEKVLAAGGDRSRATCALAASLARQQQPDEAVRCLERALAADPDDVPLRIALGNCALERGDPGAAEAEFRRAIAAAGNHALAWAHLGVALEQQNRAAEALDASERAMQLECPADRDADLFVNHAVVLHRVGRTRDAIALCARELPQRPSVHGYRTFAGMLLAAGQLEAAWPYYDFRWLAEPQLSLRPNFGRPVWAGQDLRGKTILLHVEQGTGDVLQYVRYARLVKALGPTVLLVTTRALANLARTVPGVDRVLGPGEAAPDFDYVVHLMTLPKIFGTGLASIPSAVPYLAPEPERKRTAQAEVAREAGSALKIGLVWSGSAANAYNLRRACPLAALAPLWELAEVRWFSLQRGGEALVTGDSAADAPLALLEMRNDMDGTAALVDSLDLVLSVDTGIAHLAGALGKPIWLMLPEAPHWTWLEERDDSPWYPTMRLFRQRERGNWAEVAGRVKTALEEILRGSGADALVQSRRPMEVAAQAFAPTLTPGPGPGHRPGTSAVAETRHGIVQYLPADADEGVSIGWYGEWLEPQLGVLARLLQPGSTVLEIGAGIGAHAVWMGQALGAAGRLTLCEPRPVQQRILRQNLAANGIHNATVLQGALGRPGTDNETVDGLRLERLSWIKVDSAAHSSDVIAGASETLWRLRPRLWLAAADPDAVERLAEAAAAHGYRCWLHRATRFNAANFNRRDADEFGGREAFALLAIPEEADVAVALPDCVALS